VLLRLLPHWSGGRAASLLLLLIAVIAVVPIPVSEATVPATTLSIIALVVEPFSLTSGRPDVREIDYLTPHGLVRLRYRWWWGGFTNWWRLADVIKVWIALGCYIRALRCFRG
jgi:hypothetical protein